MKKIVLLIISIWFFLSNYLFVNASEWQIEKILNLNFAVEQIEYKLSELPNKNFRNSKVQAKYNQIQQINKVLTNEFYKKYKSWDIDYYTTKWVIKHHQKFIYNTWKLFEYIEIKLKNPHYIDINDNIIDSYSQMRMSFNRIKHLYSLSKKRKKLQEKKQELNNDDSDNHYTIEYNGWA